MPVMQRLPTLHIVNKCLDIPDDVGLVVRVAVVPLSDIAYSFLVAGRPGRDYRRQAYRTGRIGSELLINSRQARVCDYRSAAGHIVLLQAQGRAASRR